MNKEIGGAMFSPLVTLSATSEAVENGREFHTMNIRGDVSMVTLHKGPR